MHHKQIRKWVKIGKFEHWGKWVDTQPLSAKRDERKTGAMLQTSVLVPFLKSINCKLEKYYYVIVDNTDT